MKIDGDVPYLYLEVIPKLKPGCFVHVHDVHFPYNVPFPSELYVLSPKWPVFWNEAMLLQAFLSYNDSYEIVMSMPLLRFFCEDFLKAVVPGYRPVEISPTTILTSVRFGSRKSSDDRRVDLPAFMTRRQCIRLRSVFWGLGSVSRFLAGLEHSLCP